MDGFIQMLELQAVLLVYLVVGIICNRIGVVTAGNRQSYIKLVTHVLMPCLVFNSFKSITPAIFMSAIGAFLMSLAICTLSWLAGKVIYRWCPENEQPPLRYGTLISNAGFAGLPLAEQTFGEMGLISASMFLIPIRFFMWSAGVTMLSGEHVPASTVAKKLAMNPCVIAIPLGLVRGFLAISFPAPVETALSSLSSCVSPVSMIIVGSIMAEIDLKTIFERSVFYFCGIRLVALPLVTFGLCALLGLDSVVAGTCLLETAMPAATTTALLSAQFGADAEYASKLVVTSTVLSLITAPVLMLLL